MPEGEEQQQGIEKLFEQIVKENRQFGQGNRLPGSPGSPESPKEVGPKDEYTKA